MQQDRIMINIDYTWLRMDFSRMDVRRPFALVRKSALQLAVQHMSYKACSAWCHARNIPKPTAFMDVYRYISVQSTASSWNGLCIDLFNIPAVWGKWHAPAIWSKPSHRPIYPHQKGGWDENQGQPFPTVSTVWSKSLMNLPWVTCSLPNCSES